MLQRFVMCLASMSAVLFLMACASRSKPIELLIAWDGAEACSVYVDGEKLDDHQLLEKLKKRPAGQPVTVRSMPLDVPYRCIGGTIFTMQRAGVPLKSFRAWPVNATTELGNR